MTGTTAVRVEPDGTVRIGRTVLRGVHPPCPGPCVIHAPTAHHLAHLPLRWRNDRGMFERICPCGVGHPDPDQFLHWQAQFQARADRGETDEDGWPVEGSDWTYRTQHGCCPQACCVDPAREVTG